MFYHLLYSLRDVFSGLNLFRYITFRAVMAAFAQVQGEGATHTNQEENQDGQAQ